MSVREILFDIFKLAAPEPIRCIHCGGYAAEGYLCEECAASMKNDEVRRGFADRSVIDHSIALHAYRGPAGDMVRRMKYTGMRRLVREMAAELIGALRSEGLAEVDMVTYVPMYWFRRQMRYYNHGRELAKACGRELGIPIERALRRARPGKQQARIMTLEGRRMNVRNAFKVRTDVRGKTVLLIDDVYTTGATSGECAGMLKMAGAKEIILAVYALSGKKHDANVVHGVVEPNKRITPGESDANVRSKE